MMSAWPGKFVIGLTGNIGSGKSEVRRMMETFGAFGIDADAIAHQVIANGEPAYDSVVREFGTAILTQDGEIDRSRLGQLVFSDPQALSRLEAIVHPQVRNKVDLLVRQATNPVIVIEAIKLIESGYPELCDAVWVVTTPEQIQIDRLVKYRRMSEAHARQRLAAQSLQEEKLKSANVVIRNEGSLGDTEKQVKEQWKKLFGPVDNPAVGEN
jgi:dephospho-CoA kinase